MKTLNILAVLVLLFFTAEAGSDCFSSLSSVTQALSVALTELEKTQAELKEVKAELEAEKNKSNSQTTVKPQSKYCIGIYMLGIIIRKSTVFKLLLNAMKILKG